MRDRACLNGLVSMCGSPTSSGTPASVRRLGSLPLRRRAAAPGKSTRPTSATCGPSALVCDCDYPITQPPVGQGDQRAWQEMPTAGSPAKGKGHPEEKTPALAVHRQRGSSDRQAATGSDRAEEDPDARPRLSRPFAEDPAPAQGPQPKHASPKAVGVPRSPPDRHRPRPIGKPRVNSARGIAVKSAAQPRPGWTSPSPAADW